MDKIDYGLKKYACTGCKKHLPTAIDLSSRVREMLAANIQARTSWVQAEAISSDIMEFLVRQHIGIGTLFYEAGRALAYCERCWVYHCIECQDCKVHMP